MGDPATKLAIRIQFFLKRKATFTVEEFHTYWKGKHAEFAMSLPGFKEICRRYVQVHCPPQLQRQAKLLGMPALDYDGMAELLIQDVREFSKSTSQRDTLKAIKAEMELFLDGAHSAILIGWEHLIWENSRDPTDTYTCVKRNGVL